MRARKAQQGFSLVEILIASTLGLFLVGGAFIVYLASRSANADIEDMSRMQENIRFASDFLVRDIRNAGFRDEGMLTYATYDTIDKDYIDLSNEDYPLIVRYGGRGDCISNFEDSGSHEDFDLVINRYSIGEDAEGNPALRCGDADGNNEVLVSGVSALAATPLCPDGGNSCDCPENPGGPPGCIGVQIALEFDSQNPNGIGNRSVELKAVFRNRVYEMLEAD